MSRTGRAIWLRGLRWSWFADGQVFAHFFETFGAQPADRKEIVNAFECAVRLAHLENLLCGRRADARHLLKLR